MTTLAGSRNPVYDDDGDVLISKSTWSLKLSGLIFAGLLVLGRSASYGNLTWSATFHPASTPLTVIQGATKPHPIPATPKNVGGLDAAALSKRSAASEVVVFNPGNSNDEKDGNGNGDSHEDSNGGNANHHDDGQGSGHGSGNGTAAHASSPRPSQGSGHGSGAVSAAGPSSTSAKGSGHGSGAAATVAG